MKYNLDEISAKLDNISDELNTIDLKENIEEVNLLDPVNIPVLYCFFIISFLISDVHVLHEYSPD